MFVFPSRSAYCNEIAAQVLKAFGEPSDYFVPADMRGGGLLIFLYDSMADLLPNLVHCFGYAQAISDRFGCWGLQPAADAPGSIDLRHDRFFSRNFFTELPAVALDLEKELSQYRTQFAALEAPADADPGQTAEGLHEKLQSLPEMTELRKRNKLHLSICDVLMKDAVARGHDRYSVVSLAAFRNHSLTSEQQAEAAALLRDPQGRMTDKLRLLAVIAATEAATAKELTALAEVVAEGAELNEAERGFVRRLHSAGQASAGYLSAFADSGKRMLQVRLGAGALSPSARTLIDLFRRRDRPEGLTFQPGAASLAGVKEVVCLNLRGGSFLELSDLLEAERQTGKRIVLGIASLIAPSEALARYIELSADSTQKASTANH